jgi:vang-like
MSQRSAIYGTSNKCDENDYKNVYQNGNVEMFDRLTKYENAQTTYRQHASSQQNIYGTGTTDCDQQPKQQQQQQQQQIQVQILPQDDNWGENTTAVTADFSDFNDDMTEDGRSSYFNGRNNHTNPMDTLTGMISHPHHHNRLLNHHPHNKNNIFLNMDNEHLFHANTPTGFIKTMLFYLKTYLSYIFSLFIAFCAFVTPILFIILPRILFQTDSQQQHKQFNECSLECESILISIAFKMFILLMGNWILFSNKPRAFLPRKYELKTLLMIFLFTTTFSYWLFYAVRILSTQLIDYQKTLRFTASYVDVLLFIFILSVFIIRLRHLSAKFVVKIVRSPDGEQAEYVMGEMSIQRAAIWLLEQYYKDFNVYNPWLENMHRKRGMQLMKMEKAMAAANGNGTTNGGAGNRSISSKKQRHNNRNMSASINNVNQIDDQVIDNETSKISMMNKKESRSMLGVNMNANDRFYEEYEYEKRLRKRRARLLTSTEEAFTHIRRMHIESYSNGENGIAMSANTLMDPFEAAQAIFTSIARDLRRYLRITRQQPYYTRENILAHLADCISYDMSPRSFLQRYFDAEPLAFNEKALIDSSTEQHFKLFRNGVSSHAINGKSTDQTWILISDNVLYQNVEDELMIVLKQNEVSLMCTFRKLPRLNLIEDVLDPKRNKFVLKLNSETTV